MQQAMPRLRGKPVGVIPFDTSAANSTVVIACSKEAKAAGCKNVMAVSEARALCPELVLVTQRPDLFRRAHNALLNEIVCEIPIETVKSIDELACKLDKATIADPMGLAKRIKDRIRNNIGEYITCSIGFAANRLLAKIACKVDKPNGVTIWRPQDMPEPLCALPLDAVLGMGRRMQARLNLAGIASIRDLWDAEPKRLRALWHTVNGERMWYALHGYDLHAMPTARGMFGHGRVLPPRWRNADHATSSSRLLLTKAARRMRRDGFYASRLSLWLDMRSGEWLRGRDFSGPRRRDFDDGTFTPQDAVMLRPARSSNSQPQGTAVSNGSPIDATVKWFNAEKGFGFAELADGSGDAFLHVSVLQGAGHDVVEPGTKLKVNVEQGQKGRQISAVFEIDASGAQPNKPKDRMGSHQASNMPDLSSAVEVDGTVKWFNPLKGFGFVGADDGGKDVFLHISVLEKIGRKVIAEGELVVMRVVQGQKGREAVSITVVQPIG